MPPGTGGLRTITRNATGPTSITGNQLTLFVHQELFQGHQAVHNVGLAGQTSYIYDEGPNRKMQPQ